MPVDWCGYNARGWDEPKRRPGVGQGKGRGVTKPRLKKGRKR